MCRETFHARSEFNRAVKDEIGGTRKRDVGEPFAVAREAYLQGVAAAHRHLDWALELFRRRENQCARYHARAAGESFILDSALVGADRNRPFAAFLDEV